MESLSGIDSRAALMRPFERVSPLVLVQRVVRGLRCPRHTGEYKYARLQTLRLLSPLLAVAVPLFLFLAAVLLSRTGMSTPCGGVEVTYLDIVPLPEPLNSPSVLDLPQMTEATDFENVGAGVPGKEDVLVSAALADAMPFVAQEAEPVPFTRSPVRLRCLPVAPRRAGREGALALYNGSRETELAVLRALRWLKKEQRVDGSWASPPIAMTGLVLLTYLAHGDTPDSREFGETVERGIKYLLEQQAEDGGFPRRYQHAIATYALCEAFGMIRAPTIRDAAVKAVDIVIKGQNASGGFDYDLVPSERDDTSVMGWCAQALKAAQIAGLNNAGLDAAIRKAAEGFKRNASPTGGFGYTGPGAGGLTGVGVLCMQLLGAEEDGECRKGLAYLDRATMDWETPGPLGGIYYWYYITQAKFHGGKEIWNAWNRQMKMVLTGNQIVLEKAAIDADGNLVDAGYWNYPPDKKGHSTGPVMDTTLCALQLEVYYRVLPTYAPLTEQMGTIAQEREIDIVVSM